jgi:PPOX class probable FMN-dependent enzyme
MAETSDRDDHALGPADDRLTSTSSRSTCEGTTLPAYGLAMSDHESWAEIPDVETLTALLGEPTQQARNKGRSALTEVDIAWLQASPFCVLATASVAGDADASPKGDPAGDLVRVIDETTIALAERPGNRRADGYRNILENPHVGLLFVIPGRGDTLRVNGRATLVSDAPFFDDMVVKGHRPLLAMVVEIDELFHHCAKAFLRSALWDPDTWDPEAGVPRRAVLAHRLERPETSVAELDEYYGPSYAEGLYRNPVA